MRLARNKKASGYSRKESALYGTAEAVLYKSN
jgi:hypothetical protein